MILDVVPRLDASSFIRSIKRFISRRGCPKFIISDGGRNFVSVETQEFVSRLGIDWKFNLPLSPWQGRFFERLVRSTKILLRKELGNLKLNYEQLQTVLLETETILNNRPLTYYYADENEPCLTRNHMLYGRSLRLFDSETSSDVSKMSLPSKINNTVNHFWDRWKKEHLVNLREYHKIKHPNKHQQIVNEKDIVIVQEDKILRSAWKVGIVEEVIKGTDCNIRGAVVRVPRTKSLIKRPVNRLYLIERVQNEPKATIESEIVNNNEENSKPKREAAIMADLKSKYLGD